MSDFLKIANALARVVTSILSLVTFFMLYRALHSGTPNWPNVAWLFVVMVWLRLGAIADAVDRIREES